MPDPLGTWLEERSAGATPDEVARDYLNLSGPPAVLHEIALRALERLPGARAGPDGRWRIHAPSPSRTIAVVAVTTGPVPGADHLLALGWATVTGGRIGPARSAVLRPGPAVTAEVASAAGVDLAKGRPPGEVAERVAPDYADATVVAYRSRRPGRFLARLFRDLGRPETAAGELRLGPPLRRAGLVPVRATLEDAADAAGLVRPSGDDPGDRARALAGLYLLAREREIDLSPPPPAPGFDFSRVGFGPEFLEELPEAPGVYRFRDRQGRLLYVGKARDLRARVRSYFATRSRRRKRYGELMERLHGLEWEETGSELMALLAEIAEIRESAPRFNVQVGVRRRRPAAGDLVLFLPTRSESRAELLILRDGRLAGRLEVPRRRPPARVLREALRRALEAPAPPAEDPADAEIVASWLRARSDEQNLLDLSEAGGVEEALRKVRECLADPDLFTGKFYRR